MRATAAALGVVTFTFATLASSSFARAQVAAPDAGAPAAATPDAHELPPEEPKVVKKKAPPVPLSIMGGLRIGAIIPAGDIGQAPQLPIAVGPAVDLTLEAGATIYRHFYGGLLFGGSFYISPASTSKNVNALLFGTEVGYLTNADGLGAFFGLGLGYRRYLIGDAIGNANSVDGPDVLATIALHIRAGSAVRILPRFDFAAGTAGGYDHALFFFGVSMWLNHDVWK